MIYADEVWTGIEYLSALAPFWPYGTFGQSGVVGQLAVGSSIAQQMTLTAETATPAQTSDAPGSLSATLAKVDPSNNGELPMRSGTRLVPVAMRL